jgi:hypothetical protein
MKHGALKQVKVLYPLTLPSKARRKAIERAVRSVVSRMSPQSRCYCGQYCATHRKLIALEKRGA